jgi:hypothetical protein|eukprot:COSAG02_NODE_11214_length_1769_cov_3.247904_1_plen_57_part_00
MMRVALCLAASVLVADAAKIEHYVMLLMENRPIDVRPSSMALLRIASRGHTTLFPG